MQIFSKSILSYLVMSVSLFLVMHSPQHSYNTIAVATYPHLCSSYFISWLVVKDTLVANLFKIKCHYVLLLAIFVKN